MNLEVQDTLFQKLYGLKSQCSVMKLKLDFGTPYKRYDEKSGVGGRGIDDKTLLEAYKESCADRRHPIYKKLDCVISAIC